MNNSLIYFFNISNIEYNKPQPLSHVASPCTSPHYAPHLTMHLTSLCTSPHHAPHLTMHLTSLCTSPVVDPSSTPLTPIKSFQTEKTLSATQKSYVLKMIPTDSPSSKHYSSVKCNLLLTNNLPQPTAPLNYSPADCTCSYYNFI